MRYRKRKINRRTYSEHRVIWEQANGPIPDGCVVHHINHDKLDNRLSNLMLMTYAEHAQHHNNKHDREKACEVCGEHYEPHPTKRARSKTCSDSCFRQLASAARAGSGNGQAKLTESDVAHIRRRAAAGETQKDIALVFGDQRDDCFQRRQPADVAPCPVTPSRLFLLPLCCGSSFPTPTSAPPNRSRRTPP